MSSKKENLRLLTTKEFKKSSVALTIYLASCFLFGSIILSNGMATAADYPDKNIKYIIPFAIGGKGDILARAIAPFVQERLGVILQIENVPGVVKIGLNKLWNSKPDGYTIGSFSLPSPVVSELTSKTEYRSKEFTHIYAFNDSSVILQVNSSGPKDMTEFLRLAKGKSISGATGAFGSGTHLASMVMAKGLGIDVRWVHYNSGGEANTALAGGHVDFNTVSMSPQTAALAQAGKVRPLMVVGDERDPLFPSIPTPKDFGYTFTTFPLMEGAAAPKNLPADRLSRLENAFADAAKDPRFKKWADDTKMHIIYQSSKAYSQRIANTYSETEKFKELLNPEKN